MLLKSLYLHNFRVYKEAVFDFGDSFNVIHGANAQGKTSLLEAIYFLITGRSFRGGQTSELVRKGAAQFYLEAHFLKRGVEQTLRITCSPAERKIIANSTLLPSTAQLLGLIQGVVASPDDVALVKGAPVVRRQYLDVQIAQADPLYVHHLTRYTRALRQRNCLLRAKQMLTIESWEHEMAQSAAYLTRQRAAAVAHLQQVIQGIHRQLTGSEEQLTIDYRTTADFGALEPYFMRQYERCRKREMELGATIYGPHKDDLTVSINGSDVRNYASEGQQRTAVFGLRCAEWERLAALADGNPLLLVDDAALGLDTRRRGLQLEYLRGKGQVFLTTTCASYFEGECAVLLPIALVV